MKHISHFKVIFIILVTGIGSVHSKTNSLINLPVNVRQQIASTTQQYHTYKNHQFQKGGNGVVSIGNDPNCDVDININSIQQVINNGATEIRLADTGSYNEDIFISNQSMMIRGGFQDCQDANNNIQQGSQTLITGTGTASVISISGADATHEVVLQNLDIRNGSGSDFFYGGGISTLGATANVTIERVNVSNNQGDSGGGIAINGGVTSLMLIDTIIQDNQALNGGGIHCVGADASLSIFDDSGVINNTATGDGISGEGGGGLFLSQGCHASIYSGSKEQSHLLGVNGNVSESDGGGIFISDGGQLNLLGQGYCILDTCVGDSQEPVNITNNQARDNHVFDFFGNGGGIYMSGLNSSIYMQGVYIAGNSAQQKGAGIYEQNGFLNISRSELPCWDEKCNLIQGNTASNNEGDNTYGGGLYLLGGQTAISRAYFEDNRADLGTTMALRNATLGLAGSLISNNGLAAQNGIADQFVVSLEDESILTLEHVTLTNNQAVGGVFGRLDDSYLELNIYSSIIHDENSGNFWSGSTSFILADIDCVITHDLTFLNVVLGTHLLNADPQFKNAANRDYHLNALSSPAVDFCIQHNALGSLIDIDGQLRGWDDDSIINNQNDPNFVFDAGADETYDNDIIFVDQFEQ
ncbi:MAG: hypothetical protein KDI92_03560 [Xanthomonadales bacterium]|nr:hypothetical protein [Xanthomonadales bacterium]